MSTSAIFPDIDWTTPKTAAQIVDEATTEGFKGAAYGKIPDEYIFRQLDRAQAADPKLDLSPAAVYAHYSKAYARRYGDQRLKPRVTVKDFFQRAYDWDPFGSNRNDLSQLLSCGRYEELPLGKLNGTHEY